MSENNRDFMGYEYKEIPTNGERASLLMDCYTSLGWEASPLSETENQKKIVLRRNRKIINKAELTRLQRNMEACVNEIDMLEKSRKSKANIACLVIGLIGTAFMAGSTFAVTATPPIIWLTIALALPGFILWALAPLLHPKLVAKRSVVVDGLIEQKYDEIYGICQKGSKLLF